MIRVTLLMSYCLIVATTLFADSSNIDSLRQEIITKSGTEKVDALLYVAGLHGNRRQNDSLEYYSKRALDLSLRIDYPKGELKARTGLGIVQVLSQDFSAALNSFERTVALSKETDNMRGLCSSLSNMAIIYSNTGLYEKAMERHLEARDIAVEHNIPIVVVNSYINLGVIHYNFKEYQKSVNQLLAALEYLEENDISTEQIGSANATIYINLVSAYLDAGQPDEAIIYIEKGIEHCREIRYERGIRNQRAKQLNWFNQKGQYVQTVEAVDQYLALLPDLAKMDIHEKDFMTDAFKSTAIAYARLNQKSNALKFVDQAKAIALETQTFFSRKRSLEASIEVNKILGNYEQALTDQEAYQVLNDSIISENKQKQVEALSSLYQSERNERQIAELNQANIQATYRLKNRNWQIGGLALASLMVILIGYLIYQKRLMRNKQNLNEVKQQLLRLQMNPHFLFNALSSIQSYILSGKDNIKSVTYLARFAELMRQILEYSRETYITLEDEVKTLDNYLSLQQLRYNNEFSYEVIVDYNINRWETTIPPLIAQPFVENAIQHGKIHTVENGYVRVEFRKVDDQLLLSIEDNGVGREQSRAMAVDYKSTKKHRSLSTKITKERLKLLRQLDQQRIDLEIKDRVGQGTQVIFQLPLRLR